ncbi:hypothetical protein LIER_05596 [Lithospermum erythrorhizon]|uniref:Uncharacterized protein n=1 Tax=Lithospermum erythrorhizon TaxID=34254 RepID=A0AAV3P2W6_LITER
MEGDTRPVLEEAPDWRSPIASYLVYEELPSDKLEAKRVVNRSYKFRMIQDELYKWSHLGKPLDHTWHGIYLKKYYV